VSSNCFAKTSFSFCSFVICVVITQFLFQTFKDFFLSLSTIKFNSSSTLVLLISPNFFVLFDMTTPFLLKSWWNWLSSICCGKSFCSPCCVASSPSGCRFP
jgi:hypothetical protein